MIAILNKTIKKLFVDKHVPSHLRDKIPLILSDGKIIAVPDICVSNAYAGKDYIVTIYEIKWLKSRNDFNLFERETVTNEFKKLYAKKINMLMGD